MGWYIGGERGQGSGGLRGKPVITVDVITQMINDNAFHLTACGQ